MPVAGIIAEYNPFHNGHLHHLQETKKKLPNCSVVCVMSGHFLQRGEPALVNKWARAEMAVAQGVDLVLELPVLYSCRSAYWFGRGGLGVLAATGAVSHFSFGVESSNLAELERAATHLTAEGPAFQECLRENLKKGLSFPRARAIALGKIMGGSEKLWSMPNNVLALAYLRVLHELKLPLIPIAVKRIGADYNDQELQAGQNPSATAIRTSLNSAPINKFPEALLNVQDYLPTTTANILSREYREGRCPVKLEDLAPQILTLLRRSSAEELSQLIDVKEGLECRFKEAALSATSLAEFLSAVKTKRFTYTRLQRFLVHLLLNYTQDKETALAGGPPYLRVLAFNRRGQALLKEIKESAAVPLITKGGHSKKLAAGDPRFALFWELDTLASDLYSLLYPRAAARIGTADYLLAPLQYD